jgi:hypothetical protein
VSRKTGHASAGIEPERGSSGSVTTLLDIVMLPEQHHDVRTTLTLDDDVARKLDLERRRLGISFKEVVNRALRSALNRPAEKTPGKPFQVKAQDLGLRPGLSYDDVDALLDEVEGPLRR